MTALTPMDRRSRALWQEQAARKRLWYARPGFLFKRSSGVVGDVRFTHSVLLHNARTGQRWDPYWWA